MNNWSFQWRESNNRGFNRILKLVELNFIGVWMVFILYLCEAPCGSTGFYFSEMRATYMYIIGVTLKWHLLQPNAIRSIFLLKYAEPKVVVIGIQLAVIRYKDLVDISIWSYPWPDPDERERDREEESRQWSSIKMFVLNIYCCSGF